MSLKRKRSEVIWQVLDPVSVSGPNFCPEILTHYEKGRRLRGSMNADLKKHLLFLGWKIEFAQDTGVSRFRYTSPQGKTYLSLVKVCDYLIHNGEQRAEEKEEERSGTEIVPGPPCEDPVQFDPELEPCSPSRYSGVADSEPEPLYCPQAVVEWYMHANDKKKKNRNDCSAKAKGHLLAIGWTFFYKEKGSGTFELRYKSPTGKVYYSLKMACRTVIDEGGVSESVVDCSNNSPGSNASSVLSSCEIVEFQQDPPSQIFPIAVEKSEVKVIVESQQDPSSQICPIAVEKKAEKSEVKVKLKKVVPKLKKSRGGKGGKRFQSGYVLRSSTEKMPMKSRTVLSWLVENNVINVGQKAVYSGGRESYPLATGSITCNGIECECCSKHYTLTGFEAHAGSKKHRPSTNIFLDDGRSLLDCQRQLMWRKKMKEIPTEEPATDCLNENDHVCSVCHYGGELILCDQCPASFHRTCLGLEQVPDGDWFCPSCCCEICRLGKLEEEEKYKSSDVLNCDQCERKFHIRCLSKRGEVKLERENNENWFCSRKCEEIHLGLNNLLGKRINVGPDNDLTWTLLKSMIPDDSSKNSREIEYSTENNSKLNVALGIMHECFEPVNDPLTKRDLVTDVIFGRESELKRLNFKGFYTVVLEKNDQLICVATVRVCGERVAEVPLVATRFQFRRLGMCRVLMKELEKQLMELGVEQLTLPAVPDVVNTWTGSFGFSVMPEWERLRFLNHTFLDFAGTVMCQKMLLAKTPVKTVDSALAADRIRLWEDDMDIDAAVKNSIEHDGSKGVDEVVSDQSKQILRRRSLEMLF